MSEIRIAHLERDLGVLKKRLIRAVEILHPFSSFENTPGMPTVTRAINDACAVLDSGMTCTEEEVAHREEDTGAAEAARKEKNP